MVNSLNEDDLKRYHANEEREYARAAGISEEAAHKMHRMVDPANKYRGEIEDSVDKNHGCGEDAAKVLIVVLAAGYFLTNFVRHL